jgi:hypothetical protein
MLGIEHPFTHHLYEQDGTGLVKVSVGDRWGLFKSDGRWVEGEIKECDPQLCGWVSGPQYGNHRLVEATTE